MNALSTFTALQAPGLVAAARLRQDAEARTATERELPPTTVQFLSGQHVSVGFGRRATPAEAQARIGGYPYEIVFVGLIVFER